MKTKLFNSLIKPLGAALAVALALAFASCGGGGGNNSPTAIAVTGVSLNKTALTLSIGAQETLTATVSPSNAANKAVTWNSSNASVTTVNGGVVTALSAGTATITVTTQDGGRTATCSVTVEQGAIAATGLSLNKNTMALTVGGSETLAPTLQPGNATNQNVAWASSNTNIATVSGSGAVTAASVGNATITATTQDGSHTAKCTVTVAAQSVPVSGLTLNKNTMTLAAGDATGTLVPAIAPINATNQNVTWTSSNTAVATVSARGIVTPLSVGNATITATAQGNRTAVCTVSVVSAPIQATAVQPNKYSMTLSTGNNEAFTATFVPANATNQNIVWTSSNTDIAVVSSSGVVTAIAAGTVTITAASDGGAAAFASPIATDNANNPNNGNIVRSGGASVFPAPLTVTVSPAPVPATGVTLDKNALALTVGSYETLIPTVYPANSTNQGVNWLSSNTSVAVVSSGGVVTAMSQGTAAITVATQDGGNMYSCTVTVSPAVTPVHPSGVALDRTALALQPGGTEKLTATVLPGNASNKNVYWASSNNAVAVVSSNGVVTAVAEGTATITAASEDGGVAAGCVVTVAANYVPVTGVSFTGNVRGPVSIGEVFTYTVTVSPENATNKSVSLSSSNPGIVTVVGGLVVRGVAPGTATITVTTQDGGYTSSLSATISPPPSGVASVTLERTTMQVTAGNQFSLTAMVTRDFRDEYSPLIVSSSDPNVITSVRGLGSTAYHAYFGFPYEKPRTDFSTDTMVVTRWDFLMQAVNPGESTIIVRMPGGIASCNVTVVDNIFPVTGVTLNLTTAIVAPDGVLNASLSGGFTLWSAAANLAAIIQPYNATNNNVTWSTSDPNVVHLEPTWLFDVSGDRVSPPDMSLMRVFGLNPGTATVTATTQGGHTASCVVTVAPLKVTMDKTTMSLTVGQQETLTVTLQPLYTNRMSMINNFSGTVVGTVVGTYNNGIISLEGEAGYSLIDGPTINCTVRGDRPGTDIIRVRYRMVVDGQIRWVDLARCVVTVNGP